MRIVRWLAIAVGVLVLFVAAIFVVARFHDGPLGLAPGGPLVAGEVVVAPVGDWAFATDIDTIELQLDGESSSRTTWILVSDGRAFIPASLSFPPGKRWHKTADQNGAAWLRDRRPALSGDAHAHPGRSAARAARSASSARSTAAGRRARAASGSSKSSRAPG